SFRYPSYDDGERALLFDKADLTIAEKERVLILAPFNSGKSTLAKIISGVCPKYFPGTLDGKISLFGVEINTVDPWDLLTDCGYVSQNPTEQLIATTVEEEIAFPLESLGLDHSEMHARVTAALEKWGLGAFRKQSSKVLSGGERKRVLLATTEAINPRLWLLDEPFDDLDLHWKTVLKDRLLTEDKTTVVLASRYLTEFDTLFDRVLLLEEGRFIEAQQDTLLKRFATLCGDDLPNPLLTLRAHTFERAHTLHTDDLIAYRNSAERSFSLASDTFSLQSGELVSLQGPNGSGKSFFSRLLAGLEEPAAGTVLLDGEVLQSRSRNRTVGYLFQNPDLQIFLPTVREELAWSLQRRRDLTAERIEEQVAEAADRFGLSLTDTPATMSYPLRKALQAAVYYLLDRPFYILDELDSALTYHAALSIIATLAEGGAGILLITHDRHFASLVGSRGYTIEAGRVVAR
ncbi:MAG TPA: ABC transporter ATP-binding protein, partial [Sphaerochaeta sp.]|nr:ABC transporter ATP-binding protein [Sphaerochaeta sp.]